jgi:hypothetical protein
MVNAKGLFGRLLLAKRSEASAASPDETNNVNFLDICKEWPPRLGVVRKKHTCTVQSLVRKCLLIAPSRFTQVKLAYAPKN